MAASPWSKREDSDAFLQAYACDNAFGDSILHLAVRKRDFDLAELLLECNFPVDIRNDDGKTPLHLAAELGLVEIGGLLVGWGADILTRQQVSGRDDATPDSKADDESDSESVKSGDSTSGPTANKIVRDQENPKPPHALQIAIDRADQEMAEMLIADGLPSEMNPSVEYDVMQLMAKAFVENQQTTLDAFREDGWDTNRKHSRLQRPFLHYICEQAKDIGPVQRAIEAGASAQAKDLGGATVLHIAAQRGRCDDGSVVEYLIDAGARADTTDIVFNGTPLTAAIQGQKIANVRVLLAAGSDVNHVVRFNKNRRTLLHLAAQDGIPEIIQLLLDRDADPNALDEEGATTARFAIISKLRLYPHGTIPVLRGFSCDSNARDELAIHDQSLTRRNRKLILADNHVEAVKVLLDGGLDPNFDQGYSLRLAVSKGRQSIMELFVQHGAKVEASLVRINGAQLRHGQVPFLNFLVKNMSTDEDTGSDTDVDGDEVATDSKANKGSAGSPFRVRVSLAEFNVPTMMEADEPNLFRLCAVLVEHNRGKGVTELDDLSRALLICICVENGLESGLSRLLAVGAISKTIRSFKVRPYRWTALHLAAYLKHTPLAQTLISHGWSLTEEDDLGRTPLDLAVYSDHVDLVRELLAARGIAEHRDRSGQTPLHYAVSGSNRGNLQLLEHLVAAGCDVAKVSTDGNTVLHRAAQYNLEAAAIWLLERGISPSLTDKFLNTPLHVAAFFKATAVVRVLLAHGAQLNRVTADGRTPLHCACEVGADDAVAALLDAGADPKKTNRRGHTALAAAIHRGACNLQTIRALLERTEVDWINPRSNHIVSTAGLALKTPNRAPTLKLIIDAMRAAVGEKKTSRIIKRLMPELVPEIFVCSGDFDRGSPADVIPLLLDYLPENPRTRHTVLFFMIVAVIKHGGDDDGQLTRRLLLLDESNVTQALRGNWGLQHLCFRYGRTKQLRVFLGLGLSPFSRVVIDGVTRTPKSVAEKFAPDMVPHIERIFEGMDVLGDMCRADPGVFPMLRKVLGPEHFAREVVDLSGVFEEQDSN